MPHHVVAVDVRVLVDEAPREKVSHKQVELNEQFRLRRVAVRFDLGR